MPKVSIIVPVYNVEKYIERCVKSILEQDYDNLEVIFVDDCSPDHSVDIIKCVVQNYPKRIDQVSIIQHKKNQGVSVARNTGLDNMTGDFFTVVDADDYLMPKAISRLVAKQEEEDYDMVSGIYNMDYGDRTQKLWDKDIKTVDELLKCCCGGGYHNNVARIIRTKLIFDNNIRYPKGIKIGEDWIFFTELLMHVRSMAQIEHVVYYYDFSNQGSAMHQVMKGTDSNEWLLADCFALCKIIEIVKERGSDFVLEAERFLMKRIEEGLMSATSLKKKDIFNSYLKYIPYIRDVRNERCSLINTLSVKGYPNFIAYQVYTFAGTIKQNIKKMIGQGTISSLFKNKGNVLHE